LVKVRRPSHATVVAYLALLVALGGTTMAASTLGRNSVGPRQLRKNAVTTAKIKNQAITAAKIRAGTLTGTQVNPSSLGTVPTAEMANSLAPPEEWHGVGASGEPKFQEKWNNAAPPLYSVAFFKDHEGIVHLRGAATSGVGGLVFHLPPGFRPADERVLELPAACLGGNCGPGPDTRIYIWGVDVSSPDLTGAVLLPEGPSSSISFDGITFRAEG
jgi:hypothetical protein